MSISIRTTISACALVACGGAAAPPETPKTSPKPPQSARAIDESRCLASFAKNRPADWIDVGRVKVALDDGHPISLTAEDSRGAAVASLPAPKSKAAAQDAMRDLTCRLGGLVLVVGEAGPATGQAAAVFDAMAPRASDENVDLAALCREPAGLPTAEAERYRLAFATLDERLTTKRWRAWLWDVLEQSAKLELSERETFRAAKADELHAAATGAGITGTCWYETALRRPQRF